MSNETPKTEERIPVPGTPFSIPRERLEKQIESSQVIEQANKLPFPGPAKQAFSEAPDIQVGPHNVRPFYDGDLDVLMTLDHPISKMAFNEGEWGGDLKTSRGPLAWNLCYLLTTPASEIADLLDKPQGIEQLKQNAKAKFSKVQLGELIIIQRAIAQQFGIYLSPVVGFQPDDGDGSKKK